MVDCDILSWLPGVIKFPVTSWIFVGRIEYWSFEKFNAHTAQALFLRFGSFDGKLPLHVNLIMPRPVIQEFVNTRNLCVVQGADPLSLE